jgi:hypothetical protein
VEGPGNPLDATHAWLVARALTLGLAPILAVFAGLVVVVLAQVAFMVLRYLAHAGGG